MPSSFRRSFNRAGGKMAEGVVGMGMKELLAQLLETPEVKEDKQLGLLLKSAQIKVAESGIPTDEERKGKLEYQKAQTESLKQLGKYRERSPGMGRSGTPGQPTFGNTALIYNQVATEIRNRSDIMVGLVNGTYTNDDIAVMIDQEAETRTDAVLQKYKEIVSGKTHPPATPKTIPTPKKYKSLLEVQSAYDSKKITAAEAMELEKQFK